MEGIKKILIANRGEIACRVIRTAHKLNIRTVAVYSEADREAPHVLKAGEAVYIGPANAADSYLNMDKIIEAARKSSADAIHPGYGFLSENAAFAQRCKDEGLIFIGPGPDAIRIMGSKLAAKEAVKSYDIPLVPGLDQAITDLDYAKEYAERIGYPVLIKASAGGGGKGMRIVEKTEDFEAQMERAVSEAKSAFGDGSVFIEKYIKSPRHIEIQILADKHGSVIHLNERECSIQRRHQKVVEEAPSPAVDGALRERMGRAAINVAKSCQYEGAGTVEFLIDAESNFYFLEMNTRLQVEHPVTEMITGIDLVEHQIRIAQGEHLDLKQEDVGIHGHSIELRVYAEDPLDNFLPSIGLLEQYKRPEGKGVRVDDGYDEGMEIPIFYDPMIAKLIVHGQTRAVAIQTLKKAISNYHIIGPKTTLAFGTYVCNHPKFIEGDIDTHFVKNHYSVEAIRKADQQFAEVAARLALKEYRENRQILREPR